MSINDIELSGELLQALYKDSLVITTPEKRIAKEVKAPMPPLQYLGNNSKQFVILVNYPEQLHLPDESFTFLANLLKACQLNAADVAIVNLAKQDISLPELRSQLQPSVIVSFGDNSLNAELPSPTPLIAEKTNEFGYMLAPPIETLNQVSDTVKPLKKKLWDGILQLIKP
ncbi:hypothetical protein [Flavihumibacter sp. ZG627]|uniref:hypothetical protein n=1 Tax=Flavihumibacter sp. ZG627 TaxID=1463156 RepID=UPI000694B838|nr:hypothetical protein [Flavihumibacter sp. ZG627]